MILFAVLIILFILVFALNCCCRASSRSEKVIEAYHIQEAIKQAREKEDS